VATLMLTVACRRFSRDCPPLMYSQAQVFGHGAARG